MTRVVLVLLPAILTGHGMAAVGPQPTWHTGNVFPRLCVPRSDHHVHLGHLRPLPIEKSPNLSPLSNHRNSLSENVCRRSYHRKR